MERKKERKKKMGDRAWHVSTRKLGSTARPEKREYIYIRFARRSVGSARFPEKEEEERERKGKKRRRRASVAAFGSKRNSEGVFRSGEDWLPRDHGPRGGGATGPAGPRGLRAAAKGTESKR